MTPRKPTLRKPAKGAKTPVSGWGALLTDESVLLWILKSDATDGATPEQGEIVAGIISALQQLLERLPVPRRFDYLAPGVHRAQARQATVPPARRDSRRGLIRRHRRLQVVLSQLRQQRPGDGDWATILTHAARAHGDMADGLCGVIGRRREE